ncbi:ALG6 [Acanthosepion pharaonis]|uniref:Alpha-1,3-glucosyltransferase n=1 Tax=Acanthosepion pharaonis TaxID=158019 RepID=A0A812DB63_ACAPH|nr:ALG6 [Sepia pharaonis]
MRYTVFIADLLIYIPALCLYIYISNKCENSKIMELYHAWPFFCYLLGKCYHNKKNRLLKLINIALSVIATFAVCFSPFLQRKEDILQVFHRLFPFARGLYEDKVANIWCSLSVLIKLKEIFSLQSLLLLCLVCTVFSLLPSGLNLIRNPTFLKFKLALANSSLVFFLLSFQVHEKSILLAALPVCLLLPDYPFVSFWFLMISTFSMFPLFVKDDLVLHYFSTLLLFYVVVGITFNLTPNQPSKNQFLPWIYPLLPYMLVLSLAGCLLLNVASLVVIPPPDKPDLFSVLIAIYSCIHFVLFLTYFNYVQFTVNSHTGKSSSEKSSQQTSPKKSIQIPANNNRKIKKQ